MLVWHLTFFANCLQHPCFAAPEALGSWAYEWLGPTLGAVGAYQAVVVSSALFASINGQPMVNVLTTGAVTIPAMKKAGFEPHIAGAVEAIACVKTLETGVIHPTINYERPDPECDLDYVPNEARETHPRTALSNCSMVRGPMIGAVTTGLCSSQAMATSPGG